MSRTITIVVLSFFFFIGVKAQNVELERIFELSLEELLQVEVYSASKRSEPLTEIPSSIVIISRKEIQDNGWQTLEEVLTNIPGIYMINDYIWFGTSNFGVRGFFSTGSFNTMIVMVNGVTQKEDWYNSFPLSKINVPVQAIDKIEVIRGPMSVIYGNNAFLGAINIVTNELQDNQVQVGAGTQGSYDCFTRISDTHNDFSYTFNIGAFGNEGIDEPWGEMMSDPSRLEDWNLPVNATTRGQLYDHRKFMSASLKLKSFYFENTTTHTNKGVVDYYPGYDDGHLAELQATNNVFGYKKAIGDNSLIHAKIGYYSFRNRLDYKHQTDTAAYGFNDIYSDAIDAEINYNVEPIKNLNATIGLYYRYIHRDKLVVDAPNLSYNYINLDAGLARNDYKSNWAVFTQASYLLMDKLHIIGGLRLEQTPQYQITYAVRFDPENNSDSYLYRKGTYLFDDILVIPRFALLYNISSIHHVKLMYGMAVREPSIGENMDVVRYPVSPQLKPAYMNTIELNYLGLVTDYMSINFSVFQNNVNHLISRTNTMQDGEMQLYNTNSGKLQTTGAELSVMVKAGSKFSSRISASYQKSKNLTDGYEDIALEYAPKFLAYLSASYKFYKKHTIAISGYFVDEMETYWSPSDTSLNPADGARIGSKSPSYLIGNVNLRFNDLFKRGFYCFVHMHNIFDTKVVYPTTRSNDVFDLGTIGSGRTISFGVGLKFKNKE